MKPLLLLLLSLLLLATLPVSASDTRPIPDRFVPGAAPPMPPHLQEPSHTPPALAQEASVCTQVLTDPSISITTAASPWIAYQPVRSFATDLYNSAPAAIFMQGDRDGNPQSGPDIDAIGQELSLPSGFGDLYGSLWYRYAAGSVGPGDELRVELYRAGQLNSSGMLATLASLDASSALPNQWQELTWNASPALIEQLKGLTGTRVVFMIRAISASSPGSQRLWLDDIELNFCTLRYSLSGQITYGDEPAAEAQVLLTRGITTTSELVAAGRTDSEGRYSFLGQEPLRSGESYQLWYLNTPSTLRSGGRLGFWAGPRLSSLPSPVISDLDMQIADVPLLDPPPHDQVVISDTAPVPLRWQRRAKTLPDERHQLCLYDPAHADPTTGLPIQLCGPLLDPNDRNLQLRFNLGPSSFATTPGFNLVYGRSYRWYVVVWFAEGAQYGYSFHERALTLLDKLSAPAPELPAPAPELPAPAPTMPADWTLMIYVAADNAIGDPLQATPAALPTGQLAALPELAAAHPRIRIVSLVDNFGSGALSLCSYPIRADPECRLRSETNSASPATLGDFIALAREAYPATRNALLIVAPGNAVGELAYDTSSGAALNLRSLQAAYELAGLGGTDRLDLVIYQAPLLGNIAMLQATAPYARYMLASPDQIWQLGPYEALVPLLAATINPEEAARGAVTAYARTIEQAGGDLAFTFAAYDLNRLPDVNAALDNLARTMNPANLQMRQAFDAARTAAQVYDSSGNGRHNSLATSASPLALHEDALIDLRDLVTQLHSAGTAPDPLLIAADTLRELLADEATSPVIAISRRSGQSLSAQSLNLERSQGLAIFLPSGNRLGGQPALSETYLNESDPNSAWAALLRAYLSRELGIGPGGVTEAQPGGPRYMPGPGGFTELRNRIYLPLVAR
jgi:hypothetical protein